MSIKIPSHSVTPVVRQLIAITKGKDYLMSSIGPAPYLRDFSNATPDQIRKVAIDGEGTIRDSGERFGYTIRLLGDSDLDELCRLHRVILDCLPDRFLLYERDIDFFAGCVRDQGCVVGAFDGANLVGYATMLFPGPGDENYGSYLELPGNELRHVAHLAGSSIHPRYRGNGLQLRLLHLRTAFAAGAGYYHQCGEVLPGNVISIENHLSCGYYLKGFRVDDFRFSQQGVPHFMLHLDARRQPKRREASGLLDSPIDDIVAYRRRLEEGYWGFRVSHKQRRAYLDFGLFG